MTETALILGTGPGLGTALARRFARAGLNVAVAARDARRLESLLPELREVGAADARAYACDVASAAFVREAFLHAGDELGVPRLVVYNAGTYAPGGLLETSPEEFERCWRSGCLGGFLAGQQTVQALQAAGPRPDGTLGTLIFTGATASLRGSARFQNLAVGKFGLRALAQCMAREFGPVGIHVAHVIIDGKIRAGDGPDPDDTRLAPDAIAESYWQLYCQPRSAWTQELDLRPWCEPF